MKIGIVSDIHGNKDSLDAVLGVLDEQGVDTIVCLGDMIGYFHQSLEVLELVQQSDIIPILGNHEAYLLGILDCPADRWRAYNLEYVRESIPSRTLQWLQELPDSFCMHFRDLDLAFLHGSPWSPLKEYIYPDFAQFNRFRELGYDYVILGHTHYQMVKRTGSVSIINPGSCGLPRDSDPRAGVAILNFDDAPSIELLRVDYAIDSFIISAKNSNVNVDALGKLAKDMKEEQGARMLAREKKPQRVQK